ncbi:MAG TPA: hypothetical protein VGI20_02840 [Rhizomicrobium sp.]|jgi:hypothetical protein
MSVVGKAPVARRPVLAGLLALGGTMFAAIAMLEVPRLLGPRYAASPFDDLLVKLPDRESAARLGAAWLAEKKDFDAQSAAKSLRASLAGRSLDAAIDSDLAKIRMVEAHGWLLPETLVTLCALAAKAG